MVNWTVKRSDLTPFITNLHSEQRLKLHVGKETSNHLIDAYRLQESFDHFWKQQLPMTFASVVCRPIHLQLRKEHHFPRSFHDTNIILVVQQTQALVSRGFLKYK